jgi:hypothetical protein
MPKKRPTGLRCICLFKGDQIIDRVAVSTPAYTVRRNASPNKFLERDPLFRQMVDASSINPPIPHLVLPDTPNIQPPVQAQALPVKAQDCCFDLFQAFVSDEFTPEHK